MDTQLQTIPRPQPEDTRQIAETLGLEAPALNEVDFDDLFVTEHVLKVLHHVAKAIALQETLMDKTPKLSAYWVDESLELVLCAASGKEMHLVRVPQDHWTMRPCVIH